MEQLICGADGTRLTFEESGVLYVDEITGDFAKCDLFKCLECGSTVLTGFGDWLSYETGQRLLVLYLESGYTIFYKDKGIIRVNAGAV